MRALLQRGDARLLVAGQLVSMFGDWALVLVLGIWAKSLTGSSADAGLVFFTFAAAALLAPLGGYVADRVRRRPLMIVVHVAIGLVILSLLFVHGRDQLWLIYVVTFLYGLAGDIFAAARSALLRVMLPEDLLVEANAALQTSREGLRLVAPLAGAGLYAAFGGGVVAVIDAVTFGVSALSLVALHVAEPRPEPRSQPFRTELAAGIRHIGQTPGLRQIVVGVAVALLVVGFAETLVFTVLDQVLHRPPSFFGVLSSLQGAGAIAGGLTAPRLLRRIGDTKLVGLGLVGFALGDSMFLVPNLAAILFGFALAGVGVAWLIVAFATALQLRTPLAIQARVSAAADVSISVPQTISIAAGAGLITLVDYRVLVVAEAVAVGLCAAYLLSRRKESIPAIPTGSAPSAGPTPSLLPPSAEPVPAPPDAATTVAPAPDPTGSGRT
jgi:MFS family permease